jgi:hypothetical protein
VPIEDYPIRVRAFRERRWAEARARAKAEAVTVSPPGLLRRAANFAVAAGRHVLHGLPVVAPEEKERRLAVCRACPQLMPDGETCRRCGCSTPTKTGWKLEACPIGKW